MSGHRKDVKLTRGFRTLELNTSPMTVGVELTPTQAIQLAGRLTRWAWKQIETKRSNRATKA